ncbi:MAG TPA: hypothetical protein VNI77_10270 [Nitrososphaera sp.]|nr:hypothetical protein [Nitrososphaera sp.]
MSPPKAIAANKLAFVIAAAAAFAGTAMFVLTVMVAPSLTDGNREREPELDINDRFGVRKIYETKPGGQEWYFNSTNPRDGLSISPAAAELHRGSGAWRIGRETDTNNTGLRMYVISKDSYANWRDVEMTGYVKLESYTFEEEFAWAVRTGKHTSDDPCDGTAYYGALSFTGSAWFQKEVAHVEGGYTNKRYSDITVEPLKGRWVGIKMIAYNIPQGVKLELWIDDKAENDWFKIDETVDSGGWSSQVELCGRETDHIISEPRPRVIFRVDNATFEMKNLSVREIIPQPAG